ncbi:MAG: PDZ domain-containing protein [Deltaproteobacteria bacterium]|nr:PDZ domain-containing protein [Deltaproteobacteria bacterium]
MDSLFRKGWWGVELVLIAGIAFFTASTVNAYVEGSLRRVPEAPPISQEKPADEAPARPRDPPPGGGDIGTKTTVRKLPEAVPSALAATLVGTVVADEPRWSLFVIVDRATRAAEVYGKGSVVGDGFKVVKIERRRVTLRHGDRLEYLELDGERLPAQSLSPRTAEAGAETIRKTSPTSYLIPHSEVEKAMANLNETATHARFTPSFEGGRANGFKVTSIKPDSLFAQIGIQNGDVVQKVNGLEFNSPEKALEVFQRLRDSRHVRVRIDRSGKPVEMEYTFR